MSKVMGEDLPRVSGVVTKASKVLGDKGADGEMGLVRSEVDRQGGFGVRVAHLLLRVV